MKKIDYERTIADTRLEASMLRDRWKTHLITLSFLLSIVTCKHCLPVVLIVGILHYYSLYLTGQSMDSYLNGDIVESDNFDEKIKYSNYTVNILILIMYTRIIWELL